MARNLVDPKKFKHVSSDNEKTILRHQDGHQLTIAHKNLSPKMRDQLTALSKIGKDAQTPLQADAAKHQMAEGGKVFSGKQRSDNEKGVHTTKYDNMRFDELEPSNRQISTAKSQKIQKEQQDIKPKLKGLAEGGEVDEFSELDNQGDHHCMYCHGGPVKMAQGGNAGEERKKIYGSSSSPSNPEMREKHIEQIKDFAKKLLAITILPSGGKIDSKTGKRRDKDAEAGVDKPDWRSGKLESQWNPDAMVHELAHLLLLPPSMGLKQAQAYMDKQYSEVQKQHGYMKQKRSQGEIQPMAAEQVIRRHLGLPANQNSVPVKEGDAPRMSVDTNELAGTRIQKGNKTVDLIRQSRFLSPENRQMLEERLSGKHKFHPELGWQINPDALGAKTQMYKDMKAQNAIPAQAEPMPSADVEGLQVPPVKVAAAHGGQIQRFAEGSPEPIEAGMPQMPQPAQLPDMPEMPKQELLFDLPEYTNKSPVQREVDAEQYLRTDPALLRKREIYNNLTNDPTQQFGMTQGAADPQNFNVQNWQNAEQVFAQEQSTNAAITAQKQQEIIAINQQRTAAGLPPLPVPNVPNGPVIPGTLPQTDVQGMVPQSGQAPAADSQRGPAQGLAQAPQDVESMYRQGLGSIQQGLRAEAEAKAKLGAEQAAMLQKNIDAKAAAQTAYREQYDTLTKERQNFINDLQQNHINPEQYWTGNPRTGEGGHSKMASAVGIILAGFNPTNRPNAAIEMLKYQMDKNLEAQKENMGKRKTLLEANLRQFGNLKDATDMTRLMQNDIMQNELAMAAAKSASPIAKAAAQQAIGKLQMEAAPMFQQFAMRRAMMQMAEGGGDPNSVSQMIAYLRVSNPEAAKEMEARYVPGVGLAQIPVTAENREKILAHKTLDEGLRDLQKNLDRLVSMNHYSSDYIQGLQKVQVLQTQLRESLLNTVYREGEQPLLDNLLKMPATQLTAYQTKAQIKELLNVNNRDTNLLKKSVGLKPSMSASQNELTKAVQWLQQNPNSPDAAGVRARINELSKQGN